MRNRFNRRRFIKNTFQHNFFMGRSGTPSFFRSGKWDAWMPFISRQDRKFSRRIMRDKGFFE